VKKELLDKLDKLDNKK
jgi:hypothetical protein